MWIHDVLKDVPAWALAEVEDTFVIDTKWAYTDIGVIPEDMRPLFAKRMMLENAAFMAETVTEWKGVERPNAAWCREQVSAITLLITISLKHAGITLKAGETYFVAPGWKLVKPAPGKILIPDDRMIRLLGGGQLLAGQLLAGRKPVQNRSTVRIGA